jgi:hypothetical protein
VQIIKADEHGVLERSFLNERLHVLEKPEQELRRSMDVIKRAPIRERRVPLEQRVEQGTQLNWAPRLGHSSPHPKRELSSHRYALVQQPRLAEPGTPLHHHYAAGPSPNLAEPPADDRELLLTSAEIDVVLAETLLSRQVRSRRGYRCSALPFLGRPVMLRSSHRSSLRPTAHPMPIPYTLLASTTGL